MSVKDRDIEKGYSVKQTVAKLRRLADCIEKGKPYRIQVAGEKINVPADAVFNIEHEQVHCFFHRRLESGTVKKSMYLPMRYSI